MEKTKYFYRVSEYATTFKMDANKTEPFSNEQEFKGDNLLECRKAAIEYYQQKNERFYNGDTEFHLPFAGYKDFILGKNAAYSLTIAFVESYSDDEIEYYLAGEDAEAVNEGRMVEVEVLTHLGYINPQSSLIHLN